MVGTMAVSWSLEPPWLNNRRNVSCIPDGTYRCLRHQSDKYGSVWALQGVPRRSGILIHAGNVVDDTQGCILLGARIGWLHGSRAVLDSQKAIRYWHELTADASELELVVRT